MKEDLIKLIQGTEQIKSKSKFHSTGGQGLLLRKTGSYGKTI